MNTTTIQEKRHFGATKQAEQPKKLSKAGQWMRENPNGIFVIVDKKAVNK
jgi:hypothetical protein